MPHPEGAPSVRRRAGNSAPVDPEGSYVLYWMTSARRLGFNFAFDRARFLARELGKPVLVFEALRCGHRWACARFHRFAMDGMAENLERARRAGLGYYPYVERRPGEGRGLLEALARHAAAVVGDDFPCFFLPRMAGAAAARIPVLFELVDGNGLLPLATAGRAFSRAVDFRRHLQRELPRHLSAMPVRDPLRTPPAQGPARVPARILARWPAAGAAELASGTFLASLPVDREVGPVDGAEGGATAARRLLRRFLDERLSRYGGERNDPDAAAASELGAHLHFGHISVHEILLELARREGWEPDFLSPEANGSREGFWGMSASAEAWLDQVATWRELGYGFCWYEPRYGDFDTLPDWALRTLREHEADARPHVYTLEEFEQGRTRDPLWNAAQRQLREQGRIHSYLRMLWGKKVLHWSRSPRDAWEILVHLNNKYALDGRDPNSYSGIAWCFGRFDRPWGPVRPVFGRVRYMTSESAMRKLSPAGYLERFAPGGRPWPASLPPRPAEGGASPDAGGSHGA